MDSIARMFAEKAMNYAQKNPEKLQSFGKTAMKYASDPTVQQKAMNLGRKGYQYVESNPQLKSRAIQALNLGGMGSQGSLEQRVSQLEQQMGMLSTMLQQGGKTRKQRKYKAKKTRKH